MKSFDFFQITVIIYLIPIKQHPLYELIVHISLFTFYRLLCYNFLTKLYFLFSSIKISSKFLILLILQSFCNHGSFITLNSLRTIILKFFEYHPLAFPCMDHCIVVFPVLCLSLFLQNSGSFSFLCNTFYFFLTL